MKIHHVLEATSYLTDEGESERSAGNSKRDFWRDATHRTNLCNMHRFIDMRRSSRGHEVHPEPVEGL